MASALHRLRATAFAVLRTALAAFVALTLLPRVARWLSGRGWARLRRSARSSDVLPSLYDRHPRATSASRRRLGLRTVPVDEVVGTARNPSQNTTDFLPLPVLRGKNWLARWDRIVRGMKALRVLPPVELYRVGDEHYVVDGHNRVAAALELGQVAVDAEVTELLVPGVDAAPATRAASALIGADELWQAGTGRHSSTAEHRTVADELSRRELLRVTGNEPPPSREPAEAGGGPPRSDPPGDAEERRQ